MQDSGMVSFSIVVEGPDGGVVTMANMDGRQLAINGLPWDDMLQLAVMLFRGAMVHAIGTGVEELEFIERFHQIQAETSDPFDEENGDE